MKNKLPALKATHGSSSSHIMDEIEIDCYVLEDGTAVLSGRGMQRALGLGGRKTHGSTLANFLAKSQLNEFIDSELAMAINNPIRFIRPGRGGIPAKGYEATTLTKICRAILKARRANILEGSAIFQLIAHQAEILVSAFSDAGIIAYVYEVTGYEKVKDPHILRNIVEAHLAKEIRSWSKEFHDELFIQMDRIFGNQKTTSRNRPQYYAHFIRKYIYKPLLNGELLKALDEKNPKNEKGIRRHRHHSLTSENIGLPKVRAQVWQIIGALKISSDKRKFDQNFARMMGQSYQADLFE